jgi:preprotein translocase subunit SecG
MGGFVFSIVLVINVLAGLGVIGLVLMQHGKGADMGAAFGSGASGSLFGSSGSANFLSRATAGLATVFFVSCLGLNYLANGRQAEGSVMNQVTPAAVQEAPAQEPASDSKVKDIPR